MESQLGLDELKTLPDYLAEGRTHVFPSVGSLEWFIRKNKKRLLEKRALVRPTGKTLIVSSLFDDVVLEVGTLKIQSSNVE
jgi:hypothetical protein